MRRIILCALLVATDAILGTAAFGDSTATKERTVTKLVEGVYEIRHPDAPDTFPQSNTTVIIGEKAMLVVDSCLLPSTTREDIQQIKQWTDKPVTYLVNTHWHFDHTLGNATYASAFPAIQIIAQKETQKTIRDFNQGAVERYPLREESFKKVLESGKEADGTPLTDAARRDYKRSLIGLAAVVAEMKTAKQLAPNVAFDRELMIDLGNRVVEIKFLGRGNTAGDAVVYLPKEKILVTGDLVDHPVPYMFGGFPVDFVKTLRALLQFDAQTIVPGHGELLHDKSYIQLVADLQTAVIIEIGKLVNEGKTFEEARQLLPKRMDVTAWRQRFVGNDREDMDFFDESFDGLVKASFNQIQAR
jgi:cyclase